MQMPSRDVQWMIGIALALSAQIYMQVGGLRSEMTAQVAGLRDEMTARFDGLQREMTAQVAGLRDEMTARFDGLQREMTAHVAGLRDDVGALRADVRGFDARLRAVEIETGKVVQRLAILERIMLPTPEPGADE